MEIGVYDGRNGESMIKAAMENYPASEVEYYGFDFFYRDRKEQIEKKLNALGCKFTLFKGNTLETIPAAVKSLPVMDIIFIDGGKSFQESWSDWEGSSKLMHRGTGVFVHNVGFSGVGRMVDTIPRDMFDVEILYPRYEGKVALIKKINKT
jgi:predicted O-methyltransferase YrrM